MPVYALIGVAYKVFVACIANGETNPSVLISE